MPPWVAASQTIVAEIVAAGTAWAPGVIGTGAGRIQEDARMKSFSFTAPGPATRGASDSPGVLNSPPDSPTSPKRGKVLATGCRCKALCRPRPTTPLLPPHAAYIDVRAGGIASHEVPSLPGTALARALPPTPRPSPRTLHEPPHESNAPFATMCCNSVESSPTASVRPTRCVVRIADCRFK